MRQETAKVLYELMKTNPNIWIVTADLGYKLWDKISADFPDRFINTGAAEVAAANICVGLALEGKIPFFYSITPFLLYRPFEVIRTYINHENINVKLIASGRDNDYLHDGFSHDASDVPAFLKELKNIEQYWPDTKEQISVILNAMIESNNPGFLSLRR